MMVLSGMSDMAQMRENVSYMKDFQPLSDRELEAVGRVQEIFHSMNLIPCTSCRYCEAGCPKHIAIPDLLAVINTKQIYHDWNADHYYNEVHTGGGKAITIPIPVWIINRGKQSHSGSSRCTVGGSRCPERERPGDAYRLCRSSHGAAADRWFSHLAVEVVADGTSNKWLEAVSDEEYGRL